MKLDIWETHQGSWGLATLETIQLWATHSNSVSPIFFMGKMRKILSTIP